MISRIIRRIKNISWIGLIYKKICSFFAISGISKFTLILVLIIVPWTINNLGFWKDKNRIIVQDVCAYYAYLPSAIIHKDLSLGFLQNGAYAGDQFITWPKITEDGKMVIITSMGISYLYFPFFMAGHAYALLTGEPATGYSTPYRVAIVFANFFFLAVGLILMRKFLLKYYSDLVTGIVLLVIPLTTNMLWYIVVEPGMTHVYSFSLLVMFIYFFDRWYDRITWKTSLLLGLLAGLVALIRPTNILVLLLFILWDVKCLKELKERILFFITRWNHVLVMIMAFFIIWIPQLLYWKMQTGHLFYYSYPDDQGFFFNNPQIYNNLFSWRKGWLLYTPVMLFALAGIPMLWRQNRKFFFPVLVFTVVTIYVVASWWDWWYGGGFGLRAYIDVYGIMAIPLAAFLKWLFQQRHIIKLAVLVLFIIITFQSTFHYFQYYYGAIHWDSMTKEAYMDSFWKIRPTEKFRDLIKAPDYQLARKGIYKYAGEEEHDANNQ